MEIPKICAEVGMFGFTENRGPVADLPVFQAAEAFELKRVEYLPIIFSLQRGEIVPVTLDSQKLQDVLQSGKEFVYHHESLLEETNWAPLKDALTILGQLGMNFSSFHLGGSNLRYYDREKAQGDFDAFNLVAEPNSALFNQRFMSIFERRLRLIQERFKGRMALENLPYVPERFATEFVCQSKFINEILHAFPEIDLLLDTAHASISAYRFGVRVEDYISSLPLSRVAEIHLSCSLGGVDAHEVPTEREYRLFEYILRQGARPSYVTVEYFRNNDLLLASMQRVKELLRK